MTHHTNAKSVKTTVGQWFNLAHHKRPHTTKLKETLYRQMTGGDSVFIYVIALNHVGFRAKSAEGGQVLSGPGAGNPA
jgi:hypothetical protein